MDTMNDQENIKQLQQVDNRTRKIHKGVLNQLQSTEDEWKEIRSEMEAGSGATKVNVSTVFSDDKASMAQVLHELEEELKSQGDALAEFQTQDWQDEDEFIVLGWIEALEFAIKTIKRHNGSSMADQ